MRSMVRSILLLLVLSISLLINSDAGVGQQTRAKATTGGVVEGTITYTYDTKKFWRYGRYYVKGKKSGPLAEAVIALDGSKLRKLPAPKKPATQVMDQRDFRFVPETIAVRAGDGVKFTNADTTIHNVNSRLGLHPFDVSLANGDDATETFPKAGGTRKLVSIGCKFHGGMHAWIYVFDHPYYAVTKPTGTFRFENVPPGRYRIEMVHPAGSLKWTRTITVSKGKTTKINIGVSPADKVIGR
jgi:plastocyanin